MNTTRAQKIYKILEQNNGRLHINEIYIKLLILENLKPADLMINSISATCRAYNFTSIKKYGRRLFNLYEDGESRGYISINRKEPLYVKEQVNYFIMTVLEMEA